MNIERRHRSALQPLGYTDGDSQVFKKYPQMKLQMKREAPAKINRRANEKPELRHSGALVIVVMAEF